MGEQEKTGTRCKACRRCGRCFIVKESFGDSLRASKAAERPALLSFAVLKRADDGEIDTSTGATPGVSSACRDLGLGDLSAVIAAKGIKAPGEI